MTQNITTNLLQKVFLEKMTFSAILDQRFSGINQITKTALEKTCKSVH